MGKLICQLDHHLRTPSLLQSDIMKSDSVKALDLKQRSTLFLSPLYKAWLAARWRRRSLSDSFVQLRVRVSLCEKDCEVLISFRARFRLERGAPLGS